MVKQLWDVRCNGELCYEEYGSSYIIKCKKRVSKGNFQRAMIMVTTGIWNYHSRTNTEYNKTYLVCLMWEGNAPPEDVGGIPGSLFTKSQLDSS